MTCQTVRNEYVGLYCGEEQKKKLEKILYQTIEYVVV